MTARERCVVAGLVVLAAVALAVYAGRVLAGQVTSLDGAGFACLVFLGAAALVAAGDRS